MEGGQPVGFMKVHGETERTHGPERMRNIHNQLKVVIYYVRTLFQIGKFHQLCTGCKSAGIDFASVQEHRWTTENEIDFQWHADREYMLAYSSASQKRVGGVGLLIHKRHSRTLKAISRISSRILLAKFNSNPELNIVCTYAPTESSDEEDKDQFYLDLENCVHSLPSHNILIVAGDFNARVGRSSHLLSPKTIGRHTFHDVSNDNGERLAAACEALSLRIAQLKFPHPKRRLWTWTHPGGHNAQIDHILIRSKWLNSLRNCRSYSSVELDSDHRIVTATIKVSLRCSKKHEAKPKRTDWNSFRNNPQLQQLYNVAVTNSFSLLSSLDEQSTAQERYNQFEKCLKQAAEILPTQKPTKRQNIGSVKRSESKSGERAQHGKKSFPAKSQYWTTRRLEGPCWKNRTSHACR